MIKITKKIAITFLLSALISIPTVVLAAGTNDTVSILINGERSEIGGNIVFNRTMIPLSFFEKLGFNVKWNETESDLIISNSQNEISMTIGENKISVNGHETFMDVTPIKKDNITYLPLRYFLENIGYEVGYDSNSNSVLVNKIKENKLSITTEREIKHGDVDIDLQYPVIGDIDSKVKEKINNAITKHVDEFKEFIKDYNEDVEKLRKQGFKSNYAADINYKITCNKNDVLSIVMFNYTYTGGAHGSTIATAYNFDIKTGELIKLTDVFKEGKDYISRLDAIIKADIKSRYGDGYITFETISNSKDEIKNFFLANDGSLVIYFQQYEIGAYALGIPEFKISPNELKDIGNDWFLKDIKK